MDTCTPLITQRPSSGIDAAAGWGSLLGILLKSCVFLGTTKYVGGPWQTFIFRLQLLYYLCVFFLPTIQTTYI